MMDVSSLVIMFESHCFIIPGIIPAGTAVIPALLECNNTLHYSSNPIISEVKAAPGKRLRRANGLQPDIDHIQ